MSNVNIYRPSLLGRNVIDDVIESFLSDWDNSYKRSVTGYPVADILKQEDGSTTLEFALAGFKRDDLEISIQPEKRTITVTGNANKGGDAQRRIARRNFTKTYVNYDDNLDLAQATAKFEDGLLTITVPARPETKPVTLEIK